MFFLIKDIQGNKNIYFKGKKSQRCKNLLA